MSVWDRHGEEGVPQTGTFSIGRTSEVFGVLNLRPRNCALELRHKSFIDMGGMTDGYMSLHGTMHDMTKVSLLKCVPLETHGRTMRSGESYNYVRFAPNFALFGDAHLGPAEKAVTEISFFIDDADALYYDWGAFGHVLRPEKYIEKVAAANSELDKDLRKHATGPDAAILYFTGQRQICSTQTALGTITATHNLRQFLPGVRGLKIENSVCLTISFPEPVTFDHSIGSMMTLLRFLELCIGRPQTIERFYVFLPEKDGAPVALDVYWSHRPRREITETDVWAGELLLDPIGATTEYSSVLADWLDREATWQDARFRFSNGFNLQRKFTIDRLVGAANMFDILPASAIPANVSLPEELASTRDHAQATFRKLPASYERDQVLNALGRLGKPALKHKIRYRAQLILDQLEPGHIPGLVLITDAAVDCRNHYVHGSESKIDFSQHLGLLAFLTEALEFVFGASDLVDAGWNFKAWYDGARSTTHPFSEFLHSYPRGLTSLQDLMK